MFHGSLDCSGNHLDVSACRIFDGLDGVGKTCENFVCLGGLKDSRNGSQASSMVSRKMSHCSHTTARFCYVAPVAAFWRVFSIATHRTTILFLLAVLLLRKMGEAARRRVMLVGDFSVCHLIESHVIKNC